MADESNIIDENIDVRNEDITEDIEEGQTEVSADGGRDYLEETSAEMAAPVDNRDIGRDVEATAEGGRGWGYTAIALSIISLFILPVLFGAAGIVLGFVARRRGAEGLGATAIGIGAVAIIIGLFILPFV